MIRLDACICIHSSISNILHFEYASRLGFYYDCEEIKPPKMYETVWFYTFILPFFSLSLFKHASTYAVNLKPKFKKAPNKLTGNKVLFTVLPQHGWHKAKRKLWPICAMRNHFSLWWFFFRLVFHFRFSVLLLRQMKTFKFSLKNDEKAWHFLLPLLLLEKKTMIQMNGCVCHDARRFSKEFSFNFSFSRKTLESASFPEILSQVCFINVHFRVVPFIFHYLLHPPSHAFHVSRSHNSHSNADITIWWDCANTLDAATNSCRQ